jgi:pimeloyl-ACP methyl ester carboxylesterase
MSRRSEMITVGKQSIETYVDGAGPDVLIIPSYGRDSGDDFDPFTATVVGAGYRVLRPQPRGIGGSTGPMADVVLDDLADDIAHVIDEVGDRPAVVLGHAFGNFVADQPSGESCRGRSGRGGRAGCSSRHQLCANACR